MPLEAVVNRAQPGVKSRGMAECDRFRLTRRPSPWGSEWKFLLTDQVLNRNA
ncbi:hypothetical protein [Azospirillum largimobile]